MRRKANKESIIDWTYFWLRPRITVHPEPVLRLRSGRSEKPDHGEPVEPQPARTADRLVWCPNYYGLISNSYFFNRTNRGFTLIEVTITLTILGLILLIVFGAFRMGVSAWEKGESIKDEYERVRIASQLISRQFKSMVPYRVKTQKAEGDYLAFEGKPQTVRFVSAVSSKVRQPEGFVYAVYEFKQEGTGEGHLILYEQRALNKDLFDGHPKEEEGVSLCEGISTVKFEYYREENPDKNQEAGWVNEWNAKEEKELPRAIRMTMTYRKNGTVEEDSVAFSVAVPAWKPEPLAATAAGRGPVQQRFQRRGFQ